ncbi:MAG: glycosyltransferase family 2 protein [Candidatus Sericytochromatia bacterium]|nr:glycosyltransferase family 2 protein [Candidatus Sericytochromatia bacterium]
MTDSRPRLSVLMPVFNETRSIRQILAKVRALPIDHEIVVVDDGSSDGTRAILEEEGRVPGTRVFLHARNQGKGAAIRTGLREVRGTYVVVQDADLEYEPAELPGLLEPLEAGEADVVYGSRFLGRPESMTLLHRFGNMFLTWTTNVLYGARLTDMETCYKVFRTDLVQPIRIVSDRFDFEPEITAKVLRTGMRVTERPIRYHGRTAHEGKRITWRDGFAALAALWRWRWAPMSILKAEQCPQPEKVTNLS